jgi:hypothetical protein
MITRQPSVTASDSIGRADSNPSAHPVNGTTTVVEGNQVTYVPAGTGPAYRSPVDQITFLITGEQTGGAFFMAEVSVAPGGGRRRTFTTARRRRFTCSKRH